LYWAHLPGPTRRETFVENFCNDKVNEKYLKIISYNIAYGHGASVNSEPIGDKQTIESYLNRIADLITAKEADIVLLQEVDFASKRTHYVNEIKYLSEKSGLGCYACVTTWNKNYVPYPYWPPAMYFGRMKSGQCVLSKFPISNNRRIALPTRKDKPFFYIAFYLDRVIQEAEIMISGIKYKIFNVHQEAYDIKTRERHATILTEKINKNSDKNIIVGGDFNALPPNATIKKKFSDNPEDEWEDVSSDQTMELFIKGVPNLTEVIPETTPENQTLTYPSFEPSRRIDYIFLSDNLEVVEASVLTEAGNISDHLPVYAEFKR
jgi:endonuclease/exonuclease/phosphatase family metal-dependent hydrolase